MWLLDSLSAVQGLFVLVPLLVTVTVIETVVSWVTAVMTLMKSVLDLPHSSLLVGIAGCLEHTTVKLTST